MVRNEKELANAIMQGNSRIELPCMMTSLVGLIR